MAPRRFVPLLGPRFRERANLSLFEGRDDQGAPFDRSLLFQALFSV
ncbi:protein of unknown function [Candidatus Methylacidiphilum fumarolicum]|uniref:Transposase n=1 Tax=Candidatus Methylacidiphilum fumarolicum TaxID=591154 RepID=A0ABN8XES9_9BACT|nr:protein of unknown function [Candidatus Methylacidiphilum fumarolicum]